jgi:hypothetical protein
VLALISKAGSSNGNMVYFLLIAPRIFNQLKYSSREVIPVAGLKPLVTPTHSLVSSSMR